MDISIIVPSYNALGKFERCLTSLRNQTIAPERYEVIFVDDCSTDGTFAYLQQQALNQTNWRVLQLPQNSGSPSRPRNIGMAEARGDYIFFLDCDDEILPDTLERHYAHAKTSNACIVRGFLLADDGKQQLPMNKVVDWQQNLDKAARISLILAKQSTIPCSLIKRSLLLAHNVLWPEDLKMGEDTVFLAEVLAQSSVIEYIDHPTYIYNQRMSFIASSTQSYGARELRNHLLVWQRVQNTLKQQNVDYLRIRLQKGLQAVLHSMIFKSKRDIQQSDFTAFADFVSNNWDLISSFNYIQRFRDILAQIVRYDYNEFIALTRPRLLIAGYDLKFIKPAFAELEAFFEIQTDEWTGHNEHDVALSKAKLEWADYIWCEWLLGNAVWYSKHKLKHQKLIIRMHRFELGREFGEQLVIDNVDAITAVSVLFFERLIERFPNIPRSKVRLLPNFVDSDGYQQVSFPESRFNLAMIGYVPAKKGLKDTLRILKVLRNHDDRYRLKLFGKDIADLPWLKNHPEELTYFEECNRYIEAEELHGAIEFLGFSDIKFALATHQVGFVLSVSEAVRELPGFESFHLALMDAYAAGSVGLIRYWTGCEYIYPDSIIYNSNEDIVSEILKINSENSTFNYSSEVLKKVSADYSISSFVNLFMQFYKEA